MYLLHCANNSLYCGVSNDIAKRIRQHNGEIKGGAKYTRAYAPCELVYQEKASNKSQALKREYEIKQMSRADKLLLVEKQRKTTYKSPVKIVVLMS
ncbi:GIY-YIG nuclease family protein [Isorropodon fossajaponicum symbiont]|uniref:GIY-YIG nuclease family protein n=1 Tax=Isorropodon fossajaponicum symbiont TaxID=883811 RepID=UPI00315A6673